MALSNTPIWHPNGTIIPSYGSGGTPATRRRPQDGSKLGVHTTETDPGTGQAIARQLKSAYTGLVEIQRRQFLTCLPLNWTAHSLKGGSPGNETNHSGKMHPQIALVGRAVDMDKLSSADLDWLAEMVIAPILERCEIPNRWTPTIGPDDYKGGPPWMASAGSNIRMSYGEFYAYSGIYGHQHAPGNDHWDPGPLDWSGLKSRLDRVWSPTPPKPQPVPEPDTDQSVEDLEAVVSVLQAVINRLKG